MENNYETLRMPEFLIREHRLRCYSRLRKADLIAFLQNNEHRAQRPPSPPPQGHVACASWMSPSGVPPRGATWEPNRPPQMSIWEPKLEVPLTKRQLKHRRNRDSQLAKKFKNLEKENDNLKSQMEALEDKITKASESTNARFKRKKIRSMKREADKITEKLRESEKALKLLEPRVPKDLISGAPLKRHPPNRNKPIEAKIAEINKKIRRSKNRRNKERLIAKRNLLRLDSNWGPKQLDGAFGGAYRRYRIDGIEGIDVDTFFARSRKFLIDLLSRETINRAVRSQATTWIRFVKNEVEQIELAFNSKMLAVCNLSDMDEIVSAMIEHMKQQIENPALRDSKFVFDRIIHMDIDIDFHRLNLTRGSSYILLPDWLAEKNTIINPKNSDLECFKWAAIAAMRWEEIDRDHQRISKLRRYEDDFDWDGIKFPASIRDIKRFESRNEITINILALEDKKVYICRKGNEYDRVANLMLITDHNKKHYVVIKSLKRLLSRQNSKHKESQHFCVNCLQGFAEQKSRDEHYVYCRTNEAVRIEMPKKKPIAEYSDGQYQFKVPFMMYADFESILEPIQGASNNPNISSTRGVNMYTPSGWCAYSKFAYGKVTNPLTQYRGSDCVGKFCEHIISEAKRLYNSFPECPMEPLAKSQIKEYKWVTKCHICFKPFSEKKRKVRDDCHYSGLYRGAAHFSCNLQYKIPSYIPVVFHNLAGYDAHLFITELAKYTTGMGIMAKNTEDYISFSIKVEVDKYVDK